MSECYGIFSEFKASDSVTCGSQSKIQAFDVELWDIYSAALYTSRWNAENLIEEDIIKEREVEILIHTWRIANIALHRQMRYLLHGQASTDSEFALCNVWHEKKT